MQHERIPRRVKAGKAAGVYKSSAGRFEFNWRDKAGRLHWQTVDGDYQAAVAARRAMLSKKDRGETVAPSRQTFAGFAAEWEANLDKRPRTVELYKSVVRLHLVPTLGAKRLSSITPDDVARIVRAMRTNGYAEWTIANTLTVLSSALRRAVRQGLIASNPVAALERHERPKISGDEKRILNEAEITRLLDAGDAFRPMIAVGLFAGLRLAEALGLVWDDVNFERGFLHVRAQLSRDRRRVEVKTGAGRRDVSLVPQLGRVLKEHRLASRHSGGGDFVFPAPTGVGRDHRSAGRGISRAVGRAGLEDVSFHSLRHTYASILIVGLRQDPHSVARQLGHANATTTLRVYSHIFDEARHADQIRQALEDGFGHLLEPGKAAGVTRGSYQHP